MCDSTQLHANESIITTTTTIKSNTLVVVRWARFQAWMPGKK